MSKTTKNFADVIKAMMAKDPVLKAAVEKEMELAEEETAAHEQQVDTDKMIYLNGSKTSFRCECGGNVFREEEPGRYECNSCAASYRGEK